MQAFKFKLILKSRNPVHELDRSRLLCWEIHNWAIRYHRHYYGLFKKHLHHFRLSSRMAVKKKTKRRSHWKDCPSQAAQLVIQRIDHVYQAFFASLKKPGCKAGRPGFKTRHKFRSFTLMQTFGYKILGTGKVRIGKSVFKFHQSQSLKGKIKTVNIKLSPAGEWWITFVTDHEPVEVKSRSGNSVGLDFGLKTFLVGSDLKDQSTQIESPKFFQANRAQLKKLDQKCARKREAQKVVNQTSWDQRKVTGKLLDAYHERAKLHERISNCRKDFFHKTARDLLSRYDLVCLEDLNLAGMKRLWGRQVSDLAFGEFVSILEWQAHKAGKNVQKIDRYFPSTKMCGSCGSLTELTLADRIWTCGCGAKHDRDANASTNILKVGVTTFRLDQVRRPKGKPSAALVA